MSDWVSDSLNQLVSIQKGRKVQTSDFELPGYVPYLGAGAISGKNDGYASTALAVMANELDVLMLWDGERSGLVGHDLIGVVSSTVSKLTPNGKINSRLLYYLLRFNFEWIQNRRTGTGVPHVPKDIGRILKLCYPLKHESQRKIAHILKTIDKSIEKTESLIAKYQQIKAGLMHDLFTRGIGADGQLRPPREQAPELYQHTPIGWVPKEWDFGPLKKMARADISHLRTGPFGSSLKGEHWAIEGTPVITIGALGEGEFDSAELLFIGDYDAKRLAGFQMKLGDVVFSRVADVGRSVVIKEEQVGWIMSSNLMRISLDKELAQPYFLQNQLSFDSRIKKQIRCKVNSGGRDVANSEILNSLLFIWPGFKEQKQIINAANTLNARISTERNILQQLKNKNPV